MYGTSLYEYLDRIEKASLEIQETKQPVSHVITLWWGLDGLQLNEDGSTEWISRKKNKTTENKVARNGMCQIINSISTGMCQIINPDSNGMHWVIQTSQDDQLQQIDDLKKKVIDLQLQSWQSAQITSILRQL